METYTQKQIDSSLNTINNTLEILKRQRTELNLEIRQANKQISK